MSPRLLNSFPFRFMRWCLGLVGNDEWTERELERTLVQLLDDTHELDAAVVLAFDAVFDDAGRRRDDKTDLFVTNDYVMELAARNRKMLFGASIHPYRSDAVKELERCIAAGAVLVKWLPVVQNMDPADRRCIPFYEAMAHHKIPLLCHTGGELSLPSIALHLADPLLLEEPLRRGVTVIAAHCGTRGGPADPDYLWRFIRMTRQYENLYGDTSALNLPNRWYGLRRCMAERDVRQRLVHGSDWPIIPIPSPFQMSFAPALKLVRHRNWIQRDILIKKQLGLDEAYWHRAGRLLRCPGTAV